MTEQLELKSPFIDVDYHADRDIKKHYYEAMAERISRTKNVDKKEVVRLLSKYIRPNNGEFKDAKMQVLMKNKVGDRELKVITSSEFFQEVRLNNYHLSPSFVAYTHSDEEESINAIGTKRFIAQRNIYKAARDKARDEGNKHLINANNELQNACKIFNNAQSGAMSSNGTPLTNRTGHTTLTSTCRSLTSTVNMINEQLLAGNRFYNNYENTLASILARLRYTDFDKLKKVIEKYKMNYATVEQVRAMLHECTKIYWPNEKRFNQLMEFIETLTPIELTAILCIMDFKGLATCNKEVTSKMLHDFCEIPEIKEGSSPEDYLKPDNKDRYTLCISKLLVKPTPLQLNSLNEHHVRMENHWGDFIEVFFKSEIPPTNIYDIKDMVRDVVLTSDTDSSIYTVDLVVEEFTHDIDTALRLNAVLTYFIRMIAIHQHAQLSTNINISKKNRYELSMKNEYLFGAYVTTIMSKHYFATQMMVEGVLNKEVEIEIKGVHLRSAKIAKAIRDFTFKLMRQVLDAIYNREKLEAAEILFEVAEIERQIIDGVQNGCWEWLVRNTIKSDDVYTKPDQSVYFYHKLWQACFAKKYGNAPELPYSAYKLNVDLGSKTAFKKWLSEIEDVELRDGIKAFIEESGRDKLNTLYIPAERLAVLKTIPYEIVQAADVRALIKQNLKSTYAVLEALGLFICNSKITRLVSDEH